MPNNEFDKAITSTFKQLEKGRENYSFSIVPREVGSVISVSAGIVKVSGLPGAGFEELLKFPGGFYGIAYNIDEDEIGAIFLGEDSLLNVGGEVERTGRVMDIPIDDALIGRVINPLGEPIDGKGSIAFKQRLPIERPAHAIIELGYGFSSIANRFKGY